MFLLVGENLDESLNFKSKSTTISDIDDSEYLKYKICTLRKFVN